ncbi:type II toxin-antitoxin system VapC family toxin [Treponema bryantii]|uniref:type II toxin-antitoxin system VapC family toxin n=1 Tax=Treponema bryantii TaxID=163 RepID=UPI0003B5A21D|nr:type II toxin-antitoxin system VapC family toxin [Treponema bryantii]
MKYLLDTHTFLWYLLKPEKLSPKVLDIINNEDTDIYVSTTTVWEIAIKVQINKLSLGNISVYHIPNVIKQLNFTAINPDIYDYVSFTDLATKENHRDPFDRMLIHTAIRNNLVVLSCDASFKQYEENGLQLLWD